MDDGEKLENYANMILQRFSFLSGIPSRPCLSPTLFLQHMTTSFSKQCCYPLASMSPASSHCSQSQAFVSCMPSLSHRSSGYRCIHSPTIVVTLWSVVQPFSITSGHLPNFICRWHVAMVSFKSLHSKLKKFSGFLFSLRDMLEYISILGY